MPVDTKSADTELIELALERFKQATEAEYSLRADCLDDLQFSTGNQWDIGLLTKRQLKGKPSLTMDQIQQSIRLVCNQYRQQPPAIQVNPVGEGADQDTADILQGTFRHIDTNCDAPSKVYEPAHEGVVRKGFSSWRLLNEYVDDDSDDQEIIVSKIRNDFSVYWEPGVPHENATWCFIIEDVPLARYKDEYDKSALASMGNDLTAIGNTVPDWASKEGVRVAEYFTIEKVKREGKRDKKKVVWRKINCIEILDGPSTLPGTSIPVFTAYGDDLDVDGKRFVAGLVRNAKDPQRMVNYWYSKFTEAVALAPTAPWVVVKGQISGNEVAWENANSGEFQVLQYNPLDITGKPAPPPERSAVEPPIQAIAGILNESKMNVKSAMGIYDPSLGQRKGDESGKAIEKLQQQGSIATLNFADNVGIEMRREGRVRLQWIQELYGPAKVQRIINPDGSIKNVVIHVNAEDEAKALAEKNEIKDIYNIGTGRYDVAFSVGPTYQSKRQEAVATQLDLLKTIPNIAPLIADLIVRNTDIPQNEEIADRLKKMLPPQLQDDEENTPEAQLQKAQQQLQALGQQNQLLTQHVQQMTQVINTKQVEQQGKVEIAKVQELSQQEIVRMQEATKLAVAQINASKDANETFADNEIKKYQIMHEAAHDVATQQAQQQHEQTMAAQGAQQDQQSQTADQQHEMTMAQQAQQNQGEQENGGTSSGS